MREVLHVRLFLEPSITKPVMLARRPDLPVVTVKTTPVWAVTRLVSQKNFVASRIIQLGVDSSPRRVTEKQDLKQGHVSL